MGSGRGTSSKDRPGAGSAGGTAPDSAPPAALHDWLRYEQQVNERTVNRRIHAAITGRGNDVRAPYRPEDRHSWPLDAVWMRRGEVRAYGFPAARLNASLGLRSPSGALPMFVHPQSRRLYRAAVSAHGLEPSGLWATPTASFRSLLVWGRQRRAAMLKLSLGATIARTHRRLREDQIARALLVNQLLEEIPEGSRRAAGLSWFPEVAGVVDRKQRHGWLLRELPAELREETRSFVPAFSLVARRDEAPPLLVEMIRRSGERPELFVARELLVPYVNALAFLLLGEGITFEGHMQNVLFDVDADGSLTGRLMLRDLADVTVNVPLRMARGRGLPRPKAGFFPARSTLRFASNAADFAVKKGPPAVLRGSDTVDQYGLASFVWAVNHSLARYFPGYSPRAVDHAYLHLWQRATVAYLGVMPLHRPRRRGRLTGIAIDEAIAHFLERTDWAALGARAASLPAGAEQLRITERARRLRGRGYERVEGAWGDLFLHASRPSFFRAAF